MTTDVLMMRSLGKVTTGDGMTGDGMTGDGMTGDEKIDRQRSVSPGSAQTPYHDILRRHGHRPLGVMK